MWGRRSLCKELCPFDLEVGQQRRKSAMAGEGEETSISREEFARIFHTMEKTPKSNGVNVGRTLEEGTK